MAFSNGGRHFYFFCIYFCSFIYFQKNLTRTNWYVYICSMNATDTRTRILEKNFEAIHINGFHATRTDKVIAELGITKGAFYHYFPDKLSLGYAIVDEILYPRYVGMWEPLEFYKGNLLERIIQGVDSIRNTCSQETIGYGCPLNNLIQEMSPLDTGFRERLMRVVDREIELLRHAIERGKKQGQIQDTVNAKSLAYFIIAAIEGSFTIGKIKQSKAAFEASLDELIHFLKSLQVKA